MTVVTGLLMEKKQLAESWNKLYCRIITPPQESFPLSTGWFPEKTSVFKSFKGCIKVISVDLAEMPYEIYIAFGAVRSVGSGSIGKWGRQK